MLNEEEKKLFDAVIAGSKELQHNLMLFLKIMQVTENLRTHDRFGPMNPHFPMSPGDDPRVKGPGWDPKNPGPIVIGMGDDGGWAKKLWMHGSEMLGGIHVNVPYRNYVDLETESFGWDSGRDNGPMEAVIVGFDENGALYGTAPAKHTASGALRNRGLYGEVTHDGITHSVALEPFIKMAERAENGATPMQKSARRLFIEGMVTGANPLTAGKTLADKAKPKPHAQSATGFGGTNKQTSKKHKKRRR